MNKRYTWIAVALGCFVGSTARAQPTYDSDQPSLHDSAGDHPQRGTAADQAQPEPRDTQAQGTEAGSMDAQPAQQTGQAQASQSSDTDSAARLSQLQSQGVRLSQLDQEQVMDLQRSLQEAGYYTAAVDGLIGPQTKQALRRFYSDQAQLAARGMILPHSASALGLDQAEIERVRGQDTSGDADQPARTPGGATDLPGTTGPQGGALDSSPSGSPSGAPSGADAPSETGSQGAPAAPDVGGNNPAQQP
jgi:hypothetical protein